MKSPQVPQSNTFTTVSLPIVIWSLSTMQCISNGCKQTTSINTPHQHWSLQCLQVVQKLHWESRKPRTRLNFLHQGILCLLFPLQALLLLIKIWQQLLLLLQQMKDEQHFSEENLHSENSATYTHLQTQFNIIRASIYQSKESGYYFKKQTLLIY